MKKTLCILIIFTVYFSIVNAEDFKTYNYSKEAPKSEIFKVFINGHESFVYQNPIGSIAIFELYGPVEVVIECSYPVKHAIARPLSAGVETTWNGSTIKMKLEKPCQLSIELNGLTADPLFIFAHDKISTPKLSNNLKVFKAGKTHRPGIVWLKNNDHVFIEGGAVVKGLFIAENAQNVTIEGPGIIEASIADSLQFPPGYNKRVISLLDCKDVTLKDFCISDGRNWEVVPDRSKNINIENIKIISNDGGDDGIDLVRSSYVSVKGCFIHTKDDCIAIKSHSPDSLLRGTHHVDISECIFWNTQWGNGFEIGFELRSERVHDIKLSDCDFIHVEKGAVLSIHNGDFAIVEDVVFENLRIEDARQKLLDFAIFWTWFSKDAPSKNQFERRYMQGGVWDNIMLFDPGEKELHAPNRGHIRNIMVKDIHIVDGGLPFSIFSGFDDKHMVSGVMIEGLLLYDREIRSLDDAKIFTEFTEDIVIR